MSKDALSNYHPAVIFLFLAGALCIGMVVMHPAYLIAGLAGATLYYLLLTGKKGFRELLALLPFFLLITLLNPLVNTRGRQVLFTVLGRNYTFEALCYGAAIAGMFSLMLIWFRCYSLLMTSDRFTALFGNLLPALSLLLVMVLRLIPALTRKAGQISDARAVIGKSAERSDSLRQRLLQSTNTLSALTDQALEGSIITGASMKCRGYGTGKRTTFQTYRLKRQDLFLLCLLTVLLAGIWLSGGTRVMYTPRLRISPVGPGFLLYCVYILIPSVMHIFESLRWQLSLRRI
ncbi:MAG: energy-coupling factor transporter transmembrane component T [Lachnospiraceae bacterium]|nr:energy-coupling factor transporter transmembrane component T [Lachnospiraceae bacterium]